MAGRNIPPHIKSALQEQPARSGLYNWIFAHKGEINCFESIRNNLQDYDVLQVNMSPADMAIIPEIRRLIDGSDTKLVLNNDYVCEYWGKWGLNPYYYDSIQRMGDMVFGTEPFQVSNMINGTFCIPHPTNTKYLKMVGTDQHEDSVGFIYHWWNGDTYLASRLLNKIKRDFGVKQAKIFAYNPDTDNMTKYKGQMWDEIVGDIPFPQYIQKIAGQRAVFDPCPFHTYGRNGVEAACLKYPLIPSNRTFSGRMLFPDLAIDPYDAKAAWDKFKLILTKTDKAEAISQKAYEDVEFFNYENSVKRWKEAFDLAIDRGGHSWYCKHG